MRRARKIAENNPVSRMDAYRKYSKLIDTEVFKHKMICLKKSKEDGYIISWKKLLHRVKNL